MDEFNSSGYSILVISYKILSTLNYLSPPLYATQL